MKDYYDLYKLCASDLNPESLKETIQKTFDHRQTKLPAEVSFDIATMSKLQEMWVHYIRKEKLKGAPKNITDIVEMVNKLLRGLSK